MSYKAIVVAAEHLEKHPNADRLSVFQCLGYKVIVSNEVKEGDLGVYFTCDSSLSHEFCYHNNLYRDNKKNKDTEKTGFFDDNRRVRAQTLRGIKSDGLWLNINCLDYLGESLNLAQGFEFDEIKGLKICEKYFSKKVRESREANKKTVKKTKNIMFPEHFDTPQLQRVLSAIPAKSKYWITEKMHGTSHREGLVKVKRNLKWYEKALAKVGIKIDEYIWKYISGSRRVVLSENTQNSFHHNSIREYASSLFKDKLHKGELIYCEIVGYEPAPIVQQASGGSFTDMVQFEAAKPIMSPVEISLLKDKEFSKKWSNVVENGKMIYSYGCKKGFCEVYVYRISMINEDGVQVDLPFSDVIKRCKELEVNHVPVLYEGLYEGNSKEFLEMVEKLSDGESTLDSRHIKEGVIVNLDGHSYSSMTFKYKSFEFKVLEGILKDNNAEDIEEIS